MLRLVVVVDSPSVVYSCREISNRNNGVDAGILIGRGRVFDRVKEICLIRQTDGGEQQMVTGRIEDDSVAVRDFGRAVDILIEVDRDLALEGILQIHVERIPPTRKHELLVSLVQQFVDDDLHTDLFAFELSPVRSPEDETPHAQISTFAHVETSGLFIDADFREKIGRVRIVLVDVFTVTLQNAFSFREDSGLHAFHVVAGSSQFLRCHRKICSFTESACLRVSFSVLLL